MAQRPVPIFVLGLQRSGTTYTANLLDAHPQIAAVAAERHAGIHESVFFSHFARHFGDWSDEGARRKSIEAFLDSDYFLLTGLNREDIRERSLGTHTPGAFFRLIMDDVARREGAKGWVEKSPHHTLLADDILAQLPDARFICVVRRTDDMLRSRLWSYGRVPPPYPARAVAILRACASNAFHCRFMADFCRRAGPEKAIYLRFEDLRADPDGVLDPVLNRFGFDPLGGRRPQYLKNSSFASEDQRDKALSRLDLALAWMCEGAVKLVPQALLARIQRKLAARRPEEFPHWVWPLAADTATAQGQK